MFEDNKEEYSFAKNYVNVAGTLSAAMFVEAYIDIFGNIGFVKSIENTGEWQYGYLLIMKPLGFEDMRARVLTSAGSIEEYELSNKVLLDGTPASKENISVPYGTVMRYWVSPDGKIKRMV